MPEDLSELVRRTPLSFLGTVVRLGDSRVASVPADDRTAVVRVFEVLHAPDALRRLAGSEVTVQLSGDIDPPAVGDAAAFFTDGAVYGEGLAVREVGRLPADTVRPFVTRAARTADAMPFTPVERDLRDEAMVAHADEADAVVVGVVVGLRQADGGAAPGERVSEHAPDWWLAEIDVEYVEQGNMTPGPLVVLYPNSRDLRWYDAPKPQPSQQGMWLLHTTEGALARWAPFQIVHPDDYQPAQRLDTLRAARR
ncbi:MULTISPECIES: hypothetical protein [Streptomyces]|uniref:hypothetical protein n=1 Tax=Streptomyces TaxID=1883 RepID=UPI00166FC701|nr:MULTISPECIES: hypothetical protein [Streptomyces]UFR01024.1 hypothetical protein KBP30_07460 [Streptomyces sp. Go40/10]GGS83459.1 hypothetical protein GCM10010206_52600 [Streptomyces cinerochromogenes]